MGGKSYGWPYQDSSMSTGARFAALCGKNPQIGKVNSQTRPKCHKLDSVNARTGQRPSTQRTLNKTFSAVSESLGANGPWKRLARLVANSFPRFPQSIPRSSRGNRACGGSSTSECSLKSGSAAKRLCIGSRIIPRSDARCGLGGCRQAVKTERGVALFELSCTLQPAQSFRQFRPAAMLNDDNALWCNQMRSVEKFERATVLFASLIGRVQKDKVRHRAMIGELFESGQGIGLH